MTAEDQQNLYRYLVSCRHDVAHKRGWTDADNAAWARDHLPEAIDRYLKAHADAVVARDGVLDGPDAAAAVGATLADPREIACAAVKAWAQL